MTQRDCDDCRYGKLEGTEEPCKSCKATDEGFTNWRNLEHPTMTNADRIRAMSDEEIAEAASFRFCPSEMIDKSCVFRNCKECWIEWLQQPAEDSAND